MKKKKLNGVSEWLLFIAISEEFSSENKKLFERKDDGVVIFVLGFYGQIIFYTQRETNHILYTKEDKSYFIHKGR
jgi:hypothetical protein